MQDENNDDDLQEHRYNAHHLPAHGHVEENTEDVERQQGDDHHLDQFRDDILEIGEGALQRDALDVRQAQADGEGEQQGGHHVHQGRHGDLEIRSEHEIAGILHGGQLRVHRQDTRENRRAAGIGEKAREEGRAISDKGRDEQQLPRAFPQIANSRRDQPEDDERDGERQEIAEQGVKRNEDTGDPVRQELAEHDTRHDRDNDLS